MKRSKLADVVVHIVGIGPDNLGGVRSVQVHYKIGFFKKGRGELPDGNGVADGTQDEHQHTEGGHKAMSQLTAALRARDQQLGLTVDVENVA